MSILVSFSFRFFDFGSRFGEDNHQVTTWAHKLHCAACTYSNNINWWEVKNFRSATSIYANAHANQLIHFVEANDGRFLVKRTNNEIRDATTRKTK